MSQGESVRHVPPPPPPPDAGFGPATTARKRFAARRTSFELSEPIDVAGNEIREIRFRAPDVADAAVLPLQHLSIHDADLVARWVATLGDVPLSSARILAADDRERARLFIAHGIETVRQALDPLEPREFALDLERPIARRDGTMLASVPLRNPLLSDYEAFNWMGSLQTYRRVAAGIAIEPDSNLVARWAAHLSGLDIEDIRRLAPRDGGMVLAEVAALVCGFEVFVIANS